MRRPSRPSLVAAGSALLALAGLGYVRYQITRPPADPSGDGFVAGLFGMLLLLVAATSVAAIFEAFVLAVWAFSWNLTGYSRRLLLAGPAAGGLSSVMVPLAIGLIDGAHLGTGLGEHASRASGPLIRAWVVLAVFGALCTTCGVLVHAVGEVRGR